MRAVGRAGLLTFPLERDGRRVMGYLPQRPCLPHSITRDLADVRGTKRRSIPQTHSGIVVKAAAVDEGNTR